VIHSNVIRLGVAATLIMTGCAGMDSRRVDDREPALLIAQIITPALMNCPDRIWPGYRWGDFQALMVDNVKSTAFLWNGNGRGDLTPVTHGDLPPDFRKEGWNVGNWQESPTLSISLRDFGGDPETLAYLIIHEGFHHLVQSSWRNPYESLRGSTYPEEWHSRYLRRRIMASLFGTFAGEDPEALGHAIWWQRRYEKEYPDDARENRDTDVTEGTAETAGLLGSALGKQGCAAPNRQILEELRPWIRDLWKKRWDNLDYELTVRDGESYAIGALAGLILESRGVPWKERAAAGETPMEILAGDATPLPDIDDPVMAARVRDHYRQRNKEFGAIVEGYLAASGSREYIRLAVPLDWTVGATLGGKGFLNFRTGRGFRKLVIATNGEFTAADKIPRIRFRDALAELAKGTYPFGHTEGYLVTVVPADALRQMDDGSFSVASDTVRAAGLRIEIREDEDGGRWIWLY
jgi:hypothetical protein